MSKFAVSLTSAILGLVVGVLLSYAFLSHNEPGPPAPQVQHFYYHITDSSIARHTISVSDGKLEHTVDTVAIRSK